MSDKPPPRDKLASEDVTFGMDDLSEETIEELERSELGRTLESATDGAGDGQPPSGPPRLEVIEAAEPEETEPVELEPVELEPEEFDGPEDRPTIPRDAMALADMAEDPALAPTSKDLAAEADRTADESAKAGPPRPKSVRPPAPLPGPAKPKPLSRPPLPPPPPPPDAQAKPDDETVAGQSSDPGAQDGESDQAPPKPCDDEPEPANGDDVEEGEAPTKRMERSTLDPSGQAAAEDSEDSDGSVTTEGDEAAPDAADSGEEPGPPRPTTPSIPDDDPVAEKGPPGIPSLVQPDGGQKKRPDPPPKRPRDRKGKRSTVKIPDDSVPQVADGTDEAATPTDREDAVEPGVDDEAAAAPSPDDDPKPAPTAARDAQKRDQQIFTDDQSIGVVRPIQVMSDLPPMESLKLAIVAAGTPPPTDAQADEEVEQPTPSPGGTTPPSSPPGSPPPKGVVTPSGPPSGRRPPPPRRSNRPQQEETLDAIEEVIPDRMSLPGVIPEIAEADAAGPNVTEAEPGPRRPLPPPRGLMSSDPNLQIPSEPPAVAPSAPGDVDAFAPEEDLFAAAEAAAKAAEAAAREAEELRKRAEQAAKDATAKAEAARRVAEQKKKRPWWVQIFEDDLVRTQDNPRKKDVEQETSFIEKSLRLEKGSRVLDLACGPGVHAVELAARGYQMVGVDLSSTMLALANDYNTKRGTTVSFIQGDMRKLNLEDVFDGIYCWSSSFGYFDEKANIEVLKRVARALRTGGRFALDLTNRDFVAPRSPSMAWFEKPGCVCMDEMKFDFFTSRMITKRMVMFEDGRSTELDMSIRLYTLHEIGKMLGRIGLKVIEVSGHRAHRAAYFGCESPRIIITTEKLAAES